MCILSEQESMWIASVMSDIDHNDYLTADKASSNAERSAFLLGYYNGIKFGQAQKWAEDHLDGDEYEAIFGDADSGADATLAISASAMRKLQQIQSQSGKTIKAIIDDMVGI